MDYSRQDFLRGYENARAANNMEAAQFFAGKLRELDQIDTERKDAITEQGYDTLVNDMSLGEKTIVGVGRGMSNMVNGTKDLFFRVTGNDDALARLQAKMESEDLAWQELADRSLAAKVGEVGGEIATTLPLGMVVGSAATKAGMTGYKAAATVGAVEEGVTEALKAGDYNERLKDGAIGATVGAVAGVGAEGLSNIINRVRLNKADVDAPTISNAQDDIAKAQEFTEEYGGYRVDPGDALGDARLINERNALIDSGGDSAHILNTAEAAREQAITDKAHSFVEAPGNTLNREQTQNYVTEALRKIKEGDELQAKSLYNDWLNKSEVAKTVGIPTDDFSAKLNPLLTEKLDRTATAGIASDITKELKKYGVIDGDKPFTLEAHKNLIEDLNTYYKPGDKANNKLLGDVKKVLDENLETAVSKSDFPSEDVEMYKAGRKAYHEYKKRWESKWAKWATDKDPLTEEFKKQPKQVLDFILNKQNAPELQKIKSRMMLDPEGKRAWNAIGDMQLMDAIEAATKDVRTVTQGGGRNFSEVNFARKINELSPEAQEIIFGGQKASDIKRFIKAAEMRGVQVKGKGAPNSDTARRTLNIGGAVARLIWNNRFAQILSATQSAAPFADKLASGAARRKAETIAKGGLTSSMVKNLQSDFRKAWREYYKGMPKMLSHENIGSELLYQAYQEGLISSKLDKED